MKKIITFLVLTFLTCNVCFAEEASVTKEIENGNVKYQIETEISSPMKTLAANSFWGAGTGLLIGLAGFLITSPSENKDRYFNLPMGIGIFGGTAYSIYDLSTRDDIYVSTEVNGKIGKSEEERKAFEQKKKNKVISTVKMRLESPIKNAFYDSLWGGLWGGMMGAAVVCMPKDVSSDTVGDALRFGIGGGIVIGLASSVVYNIIQGKKINDLSSYEVSKNFYAFYNPKKTSWNMGFSVSF